MPQAPSPPTTQDQPRTEPLTHPITTMELPPQHRTTPDRNGFRDLPREWAVQNSTLRWDEITPGLQAIHLHSITEPTTTWALPTDRHHLLLTVQGNATITPTVPSEACTEAEEEDASGEHNDFADDPVSDDSEYTGKSTAKLKKSTKKATVAPECAGRGEDAPQSGSNSWTKSKKRGVPPILAAEFARHLAHAPVERRQPQLEEI